MRRRVGVRMRRARLSDARAVAAVMSASIRGLARAGPFDRLRAGPSDGLGAGLGARQIALWSSLPPLYHAWAMTAGGERYFVAERGGRVVGYAALRGREVTAVFVRPAEARRGLGAALLARVERAARRSGAAGLHALAAVSAAGFYERCGYRRAGEARVPLFGGASLPAVHVTKRLPAPRRRRAVSEGARSRSSPTPRRRGGATRATRA